MEDVQWAGWKQVIEYWYTVDIETGEVLMAYEDQMSAMEAAQVRAGIIPGRWSPPRGTRVVLRRYLLSETEDVGTAHVKTGEWDNGQH